MSVRVRDPFSAGLWEQQAVFTSAIFVRPGQKYENDMPPAAFKLSPVHKPRLKEG